METEELLVKFQRKIVDIYRKYELNCLRGLDDDYMINDKSIHIYFNDVIRRNAVKNNNGNFYAKIFDDILFCSDELLYFTAHLYLYKPYINNPLDDAYQVNDITIYPNDQNLFGKRYGMFSDIASQKAYNFWDRIGDLIASFFPDKIKPHKIFFTTALDIIPERFKDDSNYLWLKEFKEVEYKALNNKRKEVVHYTTSEVEYMHLHLNKGSRDRVEMEIIQSEREQITDFYKQQILLSLVGFEKTLLLLENISNELFCEVI